jgi:tetratricopeptide (TPR) repeat protein
MSKRGWPHVDDPHAVGRRLKEARLAAGLSQRELSFPGCTAVYICRIERGDRVPSLQVLRELARRLGVDEDYLATGSAVVPEADRLLEAEVALRLDQLELAEHLYTEALEAGATGVSRARALGGLGQIDLHAGRRGEAVERLEEARELLGDGVVDQVGIVDALARAYVMGGEYESAIGVLEHALGLAQARGDRPAETRLRVLLANALIDSGSLPAARALLGKAIAESTGATDPILQARLYWSQSRLHSAESNTEAAARYARMALASVELTENVSYAALAHHLLAHVELERGNPEDALDLLEQGHVLAVRSGGADVEGRFRVDKARALAALGRDEEAVALAVQAAEALAEIQPEQAGRAYAVAADVFARGGEAARALEHYELAVKLASERHPDFVREIYGKMAELLETCGRKDEALELLKRAVGLQSQVRDAT